MTASFGDRPPDHEAENCRAIAFPSDGVICRGVHYVPLSSGFGAGGHGRPCVILAHGFGGTVGAGLEPYARAFSEAGLHAVAFDYRCFGASDGEPRQHVSLRGQLQDWQAAIAWVRSQPSIDADQVILWGVSLSGGHVIDVAAKDERIAAVISKFPMLDGLAAIRRVAAYAGLGQLMRLTKSGLRDGIGGLLGRQRVTIPVVAAPGSLAALATTDAESGYKAITPPDWVNEVCAGITLRIPFYRPGQRLKRVRAPLLIQIAQADTILPMASIERFSHSSRRSVEVRYYASGHFDAFGGALFQQAVTDQIAFLRKHLAGGNHESEPAQ
jgi:alpha-beta hydrolase superfamily lysophospholipase